MQGLNQSSSPTNTHTSKAAPNSVSGQAHPVHLMGGFRGGGQAGGGALGLSPPRFAYTLPTGSFFSFAPHPS